ncbi:MAG: O-methyltransferase [Bacteroidetes bacterium]|nr:O-methyltransferase [Bacteroidota bacterium]
MKNRPIPYRSISDAEVERYAEVHSYPESDTIQELIRQSDDELEYIDMLSGPLVGNLLQVLIQISGAREILEIGTFTGYTAIKMAEALPEGGCIETVEMNLRYQKIAESHFKQFGFDSRIKLIKANAREYVINLQKMYDFIYLDADKLYYEHYYQHTLTHLKKGGIMVVDNVLWNANVLNPSDSKSMSLDRFNKLLVEDDRVDQLLLPIRDGCTVLRKR